MKFKSTGQIVLFIVILWAVCVGVSITGYYFRFKEITELAAGLKQSHILAILALPKSLGDLLQLTDPYDSQGLLVLTLVYWTVNIILYCLVFAQRSVFYFIIVSALSLAAAYRWLITAQGLMGL